MTSTWISSQLAHGARVMIRSKRWGTWWTAANGAKWEGRIAARDTAMPEPSQALTVIRVSHTE
ncbi:unnamed protein product, partial [Closterium sp. NIES-53]